MASSTEHDQPMEGDALTSSRLRTMQLGHYRWQERRRGGDETLDTMLWLRTARAAWGAGNLADAQLWYRRAADGLLETAERNGLTTGTFPYYAELALGAAALAEGRQVLDRIAGVIRRHRYVPMSAPRRGVPPRRGAAGAGAATHETVRAWAAWLHGADEESQQAASSAVRHVRSLSLQLQERWRAWRWAPLLAALQALHQRDIPEVLVAMRALDASVAGAERRPPVASLAVDETLILLAGEWRRAGGSLDVNQFHLVIDPGQGAWGASRLGHAAGGTGGAHARGAESE